MNEITLILAGAGGGASDAAERLLPLVYDELRKLAAQRLASERPGQTLQATALVHEAYVRLTAGCGDSADARQPQNWNGRGHFFAAAAEAMRRIMVESARRRKSLKRGADRARVDLSMAEPEAPGQNPDVLALNEALEKLEQRDPRKAQLVKLRFFTGLTNREAADVLGISTSTADNDWAFARSWLRVEMSR